MKRFVFGECVQGFSHIRSGTECQDSLKKLELEDGTIVMAVADGHGSRSCPYSKTGSEIAVTVFCEEIASTYHAYQDAPELLPSYLNREGSIRFAQSVEAEWKKRVLDAHTAMNREMPLSEDGQENYAAVYRMYGSTLLGLLITDTYVFAFQLGDGDITFTDSQGASYVVEGEKLLGVESHSLSSDGAWKKAVSAVRQRNWEELLPVMFMLSTDGFSNSFASDDSFIENCSAYFSMILEHGADAVAENLNAWLAETSQLGCGDDTTVLIAYFAPDQAPVADEPPEELEQPEISSVENDPEESSVTDSDLTDTEIEEKL